MRFWQLSISYVALILVASTAAAKQPVTPRVYFNARLEPIGNHVIHGVGQINYTVYPGYASVLPASHPAIFMPWTSIRANLKNFTADMKTQLDALGSTDLLIPQVGLEFTNDSAAVAAGVYDSAIMDLCAGLKALNRPVYIRIGIEANADGQWNSYPAADYIAAFQHIATMIRSYPLDQVATIWQYSPAANGDFMRWYPGDSYVDWWGISLYSYNDFSSTNTLTFMSASVDHHMPVMIVESTPADYGVLKGQSSWDAWFAKYFDFIRTNANIKGFCYINWDWRVGTSWPQYGDARIQDNAVVLANYRAELRDPLYLNLGDPTATKVALGLLPPAAEVSAGAEAISIRVYPNPWRNDLHTGFPIVFDRWSGTGVKIKIFTVSGHLVKTITPSTSSTTWDLTNDAGDHAASGLYIYLVSNAEGQKTTGKLAIIR